jgi:hypothetical protein
MGAVHGAIMPHRVVSGEVICQGPRDHDLRRVAARLIYATPEWSEG